MRRFVPLTACLLALLLPSLVARAQEAQAYMNDKLDYVIELPSATWRVVPLTDSVHEYVEFIYGDRSDGLLRIRKEIVEAGAKPSELAARDRDNKLRFQPSFVEGKEEPFQGRLSGVAANYEFTRGGKPMVGRVYYLRADPRTVYVLHFTGSKETLLRLRAQTDSIARSFRLK